VLHQNEAATNIPFLYRQVRMSGNLSPVKHEINGPPYLRRTVDRNGTLLKLLKYSSISHAVACYGADIFECNNRNSRHSARQSVEVS
jgi:hypothetical protein